MQLRSGNVVQYRPVQSKGFNVKGRAADPLSTNVLVTADVAKTQAAKKYNVEVLTPGSIGPAELKNSYAYEQALTSTKKAQYLLLGYGADYLYFGRAPLPTRDPRPNAKAAKPDPNFPAPPDVDCLNIDIVFTSPATEGKTTPARDSVMGDSARNYAASVYSPEWAADRNWEWLHIVGHALGGDNEVGNLVAGTYDGNTQMIPYERQLHEAARTATPQQPVTASYEVHLLPGSWVAIEIGMSIVGPPGVILPWQSFATLTSLTFDKLQYDLWLGGDA